MLSSRYRFHGHNSLRFVYSKGYVARSKHIICKSTVNLRRTEPRIAVVISKKITKSAVKRNRVRRRVYEIIRTELPLLTPKADIVFIVVSPEMIVMPYTELQGILRQLLHQSNLYKTVEK